MGFFGEYINDTNKVIFATYRQRHHQRVGTQDFFDLCYNAKKISADTIKFVDKNQPSNFGIIRVTPVSL